ncbi:MAG: hypothetical protein KDA33_03650, partial [Phycisphaerales bacterium]|nr:hypothetical protein [Phycisphaerales bacterium]
FPGGGYNVAWFTASGDATTLFGMTSGAGQRIFRWTQSGGFEFLDAPGFEDASPGAVNRDGDVFVGGSNGNAIRWSAADGYETLPLPASLSGNPSFATAISGDGNVMGGNVRVGPTQWVAVRWTRVDGETQVEELSVQAPAVWSVMVRDISDDGAVILGTMEIGQFDHYYSCLWTNGALSTQPIDAQDLGLAGLSADGSVAVGNRFGTILAIRWTEDEGPVDIGMTSQNIGSVSGDGSIVVGRQDPFVWSNETGTFSLHSLLQNNGVEPPDGFLFSLESVGLDGVTYLGTGWSYQGSSASGIWRVTLPCLTITGGDMNCDCALDANDIVPFAQALIDPDAYQDDHPPCNRHLADFDGDGNVDGQDVAGFVGALLAP